ncbi:MAG: (Fe-S)-binding protein [Halobacteriota archaeon]|nr:(Fe-S)-binding protein [Halobacteriota archaeon]
MFDESRCELCGDCLVRCQYIDYNQEKAKAQIAALIEGDDAEILKDCITCVACNEYCKHDANPFDLIVQMQEESETSYTSDAAIRFMDMGKRLPTRIIKGDPDKPVISLCVVGDLNSHLFEGKLFEGMTILKGKDYYCHLGYVHTGMESTLRENLSNVVDNLAKFSSDEIIFFHDDCYSAFTIKAEEYGIDLPFEPVHIIEYLRDFMRDHQDEVEKLNLNIAYQRPCASRYTPEKDLMLDELFGLIGVERVKRKYDGIDALCCGGPLAYVDKRKAREVRKRNLNDAKDAGAEAIAFLCPVCVMSMRDGVKELGLGHYMLIELCRMALCEMKG